MRLPFSMHPHQWMTKVYNLSHSLNAFKWVKLPPFPHNYYRAMLTLQTLVYKVCQCYSNYTKCWFMAPNIALGFLTLVVPIITAVLGSRTSLVPGQAQMLCNSLSSCVRALSAWHCHLDLRFRLIFFKVLSFHDLSYLDCVSLIILPRQQQCHT